MHQNYEDILKRIPEPPKWFDDYAVPRFEKFSPWHLSCIYSSEAALAEITCQGCGHPFIVALTERFTAKNLSLSDEIRLNRVHYGDPPNIHCCAAGPTMNSNMHRILEYWSRDYEISSDWERNPAFEGPIGEQHLNQPDTSARVVHALETGVRSALVICTSEQNRFDLAGRIAVEMARHGRTLLLYPMNYIVIARDMLEAHTLIRKKGNPESDDIIKEARFETFMNMDLTTIDSILILSGKNPGSKKGDAIKVQLDNVINRLATEVVDKVQVELTLTHSYRMISDPNFVVNSADL